MAPSHLVVVPHTHWDREWYRSHESFRYRLVGVLDRVLDVLERDPGFSHFTLDGQTIVLDDYLEVRPEARDRIASHVEAGRLLVGPWFVLPDEWLVSGEALVRNLRLGMERAAAFGGAMSLGYVPDQFGHVGQLPQIFAGFGFEAAVLWRGVGADVDGTLFDWEAPDGSAIRTVHLVGGYGNGMHLPLDPEALARRLDALRQGLAPRSPVASLLVMYGSDHLEPAAGIARALTLAAKRLPDVEVSLSTLPAFVARVRDEAPEGLPRHRGELRSGLRSPLLAGCASTRMPQKRADFLNDRLLLRYLEPLCAWHQALGGDPDLGVLRLAWRTALENHPHDSICGCSIDAVHDQMDTRFARVWDLASAHLGRIGSALSARVPAPAGDGSACVVWNPGATGPAVAEGDLELAVAESGALPAFHAVDATGRCLPAHVERGAPGSRYASYTLPASAAAGLVRAFPPEFFGNPVCGVRRTREGELRVFEIGLGDAPPPGFDWSALRAALAAELAALGTEEIVFRPCRLPKLRVFVPGVFAGCGLRALRLREGTPETPAGGHAVRGVRAADGAVHIENEVWCIEVDAHGRVRCSHRDGQVLEDALRIVSEADRGDTYSFDPLPGAPRVERPERVRVSLADASPARAAVEIDAVLRVPESLAPDRRARSKSCVALPVRITIALWAEVDRVDLTLSLENTARDHRLRLLLRAPFDASRFEVESAFEVAERPIAPDADAFGPNPAERPSGATPQRAFATIAGEGAALSLTQRGCAEVAAVPEPGGSVLALTLLRAVGWLSRDDLARRPGHAGPPLETPGAQVPGVHRIECAFRLHPDGDPRRTAEAHAFATPPLLLAGGTDDPGTLADGERLLVVDDPEIVVSALEPTPEGGASFRVWSAAHTSREVSLDWNGPGEALVPVDLAGRPTGAPSIPARGGRVTLSPGRILTLRPR